MRSLSHEGTQPAAVQLGGQLFKSHGDVDEDRYHYLDIEADNDDNVPEPTSGKDMSPEFREILKYAPKWTTWPDFEQVRWVNSTIEWLWPNLTRGVCKMVCAFSLQLLRLNKRSAA